MHVFFLEVVADARTDALCATLCFHPLLLHPRVSGVGVQVLSSTLLLYPLGGGVGVCWCVFLRGWCQRGTP